MKKKIILLIEDNPLLTGMYAKAFENEGFEVLIAHDGEGGISLAQKELPSVILLDILMPGIDGLEVLKRVKEDPITKSIKVIVLSMVDNKGYEEKARALGAVDYLHKGDDGLPTIVSKVVAHTSE